MLTGQLPTLRELSEVVGLAVHGGDAALSVHGAQRGGDLMGVEWGSPPSNSRSGYDRHRPGSEWEDFFGVLLAVLAVLVGAVLVTGHVSAFVFDGSFPRYRLVDVPTVLGGVAASLEDPGRAWDPVNSGGRPPGPVALYATGGVLSGVAIGLLVVASRGPRPVRAGGEGLEWATWWQRRALRTRAGKGRLVVGRAGRAGELLAIERGHSLLVLGATRSGKTTGLAIPAILEWPGPVLCTSTKGDLVDDTAGYRSTLGRVQVFDPSASTSFPASSWTPMARSATWEGAMADAHALAEAGKISAGAGLRMAGLWYAGAQKLLAPYLFAAARTGRTITDVARWIDLEDHDDVAALIADEPDAATAHEATFLRSGDSRSSLFQVCQQMLAVYLDPVVARSATHSEIEAGDFFDGAANTMYVTAPIRDQERFETVFSTTPASRSTRHGFSCWTRRRTSPRSTGWTRSCRRRRRWACSSSPSARTWVNSRAATTRRRRRSSTTTVACWCCRAAKTSTP
jgi:hypothetical protein